MKLGMVGRILAGVTFAWLVVLWGLTSSGWGVPRMSDYKDKVLKYKESIREGSVGGGLHVTGRRGRFGK